MISIPPQSTTVCCIGLTRSAIARCYSEVLESKLVEPKEATVGAIAKLKQGGKLYSGTITAVGTKVEIEQRWKELESADEEFHSPTTQDQGTYYVHYCTCCKCVYVYYVHACTCTCTCTIYMNMYTMYITALTYWQLKIQMHQEPV